MVLTDAICYRCLCFVCSRTGCKTHLGSCSGRRRSRSWFHILLFLLLLLLTGWLCGWKWFWLWLMSCWWNCWGQQRFWWRWWQLRRWWWSWFLLHMGFITYFDCQLYLHVRLIRRYAVNAFSTYFFTSYLKIAALPTTISRCELWEKCLDVLV